MPAATDKVIRLWLLIAFVQIKSFRHPISASFPARPRWREHRFGNHYDVPGDGLHDLLVLLLVLVPIIDIGDAAFLVVGYSVHRIASEPERGHFRAECPP